MAGTGAAGGQWSPRSVLRGVDDRIRGRSIACAQGMRVADGDADDGVEVSVGGPEDLAPTNELKLIPLVMEGRKFADGELMELHRQQDQGMTALALYTSPTTVVQYPSALLGLFTRHRHPAHTILRNPPTEPRLPATVAFPCLNNLATIAYLDDPMTTNTPQRFHSTSASQTAAPSLCVDCEVDPQSAYRPHTTLAVRD